MANRLIRWLYWRRWRVVATVPSTYDVPDRLRRRTAVLVGTPGRPKWLAFDCPCRQRHRVMINLNTARFPAWTVLNLRPLTVVPSVDETQSGNSCHYILREGHVKWV